MTACRCSWSVAGLSVGMVIAGLLAGADEKPYRAAREIVIGGDGGWDY